MDTPSDEYRNNVPLSASQDIDIGDVCVGKYSFDNLWYRAEVVGIRGSNVTDGSSSNSGPRLVNLKFIDYGNEEEVPFIPVSANTGSESTINRLLRLQRVESYRSLFLPCQSRLRSLPPTLAEIRPFIFFCCLDAVKPVGAEWGKDAADLLENLNDEGMTCFSII